MTVIRRCERCMGTGSLESDDSTDDRWWDCPTCNGTGKVADRRRPDPQLAGAVDRVAELEAELKLAREIIRVNGWPDFAAPTTRNVPPTSGGQ